MKVIVAGSRGIVELVFVSMAIVDSGFEVTEIISGCARGVDRLGEEWARIHNIPIRRFPANWDKYGRSAGFRRNIEMVLYSDALVAIWDGFSRGTKHVIQESRSQDLKVYVFTKPTR